MILITLAALTVRTALKLIAVFRGTAQHPDGEAMPLAPADFFVYFPLLYLAELFLTRLFFTMVYISSAKTAAPYR